MTKVKIYGIKNCNTMKKAFDWLDSNNVAYEFHDYKQSGADLDVLETAFDEHGYETVINRRGMTWRNLPDDTKRNFDRSVAVTLAKEKPSIIKRPLIKTDKHTILGFDEDTYTKELG